MTPDEAKAVLTVFNSKFEKMTSYSFFKHGKFSVRMTADNSTKSLITESDLPSDEQIDAVLLNLRFFVVTNEATSYFKIPQAYHALSVPTDIQAKFQAAYDRWTGWRSAPSRIGGYDNSQFFAHMIYGSRVHRNKRNHYEVYDEWMQRILIRDLAPLGLCEAIDAITKLVGGIYAVNQIVLALP